MSKRKVDLFEEEGLYFIRYHLPNGHRFDQVYSGEVEFLGAVASFLYSSDPYFYDVNIEKEIAPIVLSFIGSLVA
ncbi:hypothetical protein FITA111629_15580 [Filibacter tadaridae]|uniref:Uncharacterized protein n=1 Tax=Filibacter tadaridae TaxID=2483811 RepID=A0A3P5WC73_9BACL|nr:hypothetical protein [Filibacter tadaridae]VDC17967.1 hypothetical protein FILTAD_00002 [Filibacter tadaridae]